MAALSGLVGNNCCLPVTMDGYPHTRVVCCQVLEL